MKRPARRRSLSVAFAVAVIAGASPAVLAGEIDIDKAIDRAIRLIKRHHLTRLDPSCLTYRVEPDERDMVLVEIREKHDERCGGAPETAPRVCTLLLDERRGVALADCITLDLEYRELGPID